MEYSQFERFVLNLDSSVLLDAVSGELLSSREAFFKELAAFKEKEWRGKLRRMKPDSWLGNWRIWRRITPSGYRRLDSITPTSKVGRPPPCATP